MNIINILLQKFSKFYGTEANEKGVYFHEDFFNQVEFLPRENLFHLKKRIRKLRILLKKILMEMALQIFILEMKIQLL